MPLSRTDRFRLKSRLVEELSSDEWDFRKINLLLNEFGLDSLGGWNDETTLEDSISTISDSSLIEMYAIVTGIAVAEVEDDVESGDIGNWKPGYVRLFMSHCSAHKDFVVKIADELAVVGIHGFVAHETLQVTKPWQAQIEQALRSMQAFVAFVHPEFDKSSWCQQETGWAFGRRTPRYAVRMGVDPPGFLGSDQWPSGVNKTPKQVASDISSWIISLPELDADVFSGLLRSLESAGNYYDAEAAAKRVTALKSLSASDFERLDRVWWSNNQLYGGVLPTKVMKPFYEKNGRAWPPVKPNESTPAGWSHDEEPF